MVRESIERVIRLRRSLITSQLEVSLLVLMGGACATEPHAPLRPQLERPETATTTDPCVLATSQRSRVTALLADGRLDRALRVLDRADAICPAQAPQNRAARVHALAEIGRTEEALRLADVIDASPSAPAEARQAAREARQLLAARRGAALDGSALFDLGVAAQMRGERAQAQRFFDRARSEIERVTGTRVVPAVPSTPRTQTGLSWSPDSRLLAVAAGLSVQIRDAQRDFREVVRLDTHSAPVATVVFSPDGKLLAVGSEDNIVQLWDVATWTERHRLVHQRLHPHDTDALAALVFSPDGIVLASVSSDGDSAGSARLWDVSTGAQKRVLEQSNELVSRPAFSHDGTVFAGGSRFRGLDRWSVATGHKLRSYGSPVEVRAFGWSPDGRVFVESSSITQSVDVWDAVANKATNQIQVGTGTSSIAFSPDGKLLATGSRDGVRLWDSATWTLLSRSEGAAFEVSFSADGSFLAVDGRDVIRLFDVQRSSAWLLPARSLTPSPGAATAGAFALSRDGSRIASVSDQTSVRLWTLTASPDTHEVVTFPSSAEAIALSPDGERLAVCAAGAVQILDADGGSRAPWLSSLCSGAVAFSPGGRLLVAGGPPIDIIDLPANAVVRSLVPSKRSSIGAVTFSPNGTLISSSARDGTIQVWDVATGAERTQVQGQSATFSPDGSTLASGGRMLRLWDVTTGAAKRTLNGHTGAVESIAFSPDGSTLASGSYDGTFRLWDLASWTAKQVVHCEDPVRTVAFMPVGHLLVTSDGALHFWTPEGAPLLDLVALRHHDAGYAIGRVGEPQLELLGPDLEAARAALGCRAGVWIYPFELCRERFEQKTVLARTLAGDSSVVDP